MVSLSYHRYKFPDTLNYLNELDNVNAVNAAKEAGADGVVLWGAWKDVNTKDKCVEFYEHVERILGPGFQKYIPSQTLEEPDKEIFENPSVDISVPTVDIPVPAVDIPAPTVDIPIPTVDIPIPTVDVQVPAVTSLANIHFTGKMFQSALIMLIACINS